MRLVNGKVLLRGLELAKKTIFKDVDFVRGQWNPLMEGPAAYITKLNGPAFADLVLYPQVPRLGVGLLDVVLNSVQPGPTEESEIGNWFRFKERLWLGTVKSAPPRWIKVADVERSRRKRCRSPGVVGIQEKALVIKRSVV